MAGKLSASNSSPWSHTGNLATIEDDGYCRIVGRIKDMVIRGGENVYPREIEEFLHRHPDVQEVQVVGIPDENHGGCAPGSSLARARSSSTVDVIGGPRHRRDVLHRPSPDHQGPPPAHD